MKFNRVRTPHLSIEMQEDHILLIEHQAGGSKSHQEPLPEHTIVEGKVARPELITETLEKLLRAKKIRSRVASVGIPYQAVAYSLQESQSALLADEFLDEVSLNFERYSKIPFEDCIVRVEDLSETVKLLVVARTQTILDYVHAITHAGITVASVHSVLSAVMHAPLAEDLESDGLFLHMSNQNSFLLGVEEGNLYSIKNLFEAEVELCQRIHRSQTLKTALGVLHEQQDPLLLMEALDVLVDTISSAEEVMHPIKKRNPDRVYISGDLGKCPELIEKLREVLHLNVIQLTRVPAPFTSTLGLNPECPVNLMDPRVKVINPKPFRTLSVLAPAAAAMLIGTTLLSQSIQFAGLQSDHQTLQATWQATEPLKRRYDDLTSQVQDIRTVLAYRGTIEAAQAHWDDDLAELIGTLPVVNGKPLVTFTTLGTVQGETLRLGNGKVYAIQGKANTYQDLMVTQKAIERNANLTGHLGSIKTSDDGVTFTMAVGVNRAN